MSVVGIDLGNDGCVIGQPSGQGQTRGKGGIDIVLNESSHRRTQTLVSFQNDQRFVGDSASSMAASNLRNTITCIKRFIGCNYNEEIVQEEIKKSGVSVKELENGRIGFEVEVSEDKREVFTPEQLLAMLLYKIKEFTDIYNGRQSKSFDVVLSVPPYYTESQRKALYDACSISGLKCLRLVNENICSAVTYGIYKSHTGLFDEKKAQYVMFIDIGQGKLKVMSCAYNRSLGGRDLDEIIVDYIAEDFKKKYQVDPRVNKKAVLKLYRAAETVKKNMSPVGVSKTAINIECLYEDHDYNGSIELSTFQSMIQERGIPEKLQAVVKKALDDFRAIEPEEVISSYEIIGGSLRIPLLKEAIATLLNLDLSAPNNGLSTTLNMDECVATGAAWVSAILSPLFRIKEFMTINAAYIPIKVILTGCDQSEMVLTSFPTDITVQRAKASEIIGVNVVYADEAIPLLPVGHCTKLADFKIMSNSEIPEGTPVTIRIDFDTSGCLMVRAISKYETTIQVTVEESSSSEEDKTAAASPASGDSPATPIEEEKKDKDIEPKMKKVKKTKTVEKQKTETKLLEVVRADPWLINPIFLTTDMIKEYRSLEQSMRRKDNEIRDRSQKRNDLETFMYQGQLSARFTSIPSYLTKDKMGAIGSFGSIEEKYELSDKLTANGEWLYTDEGVVATKADFETRLYDLKKLASGMINRMDECEGRQSAAKEYKEVLEEYRRDRTEKYRDELQSVLREYEHWIDEMLQKQGVLPLYEDPVVKTLDISSKKDEMKQKCEAIINKKEEVPKPSPAAPEASCEPAPQKIEESDGGEGEAESPKGKIEEVE